MDKILEGFGNVLSGLGLAGVVIGGLAICCYWLLTQWQFAQEARIAEAKEAVKALSANSTSLDRLVEVIRAGKGT